jgi:FkbM family methyltransferase
MRETFHNLRTSTTLFLNKLCDFAILRLNQAQGKGWGSASLAGEIKVMLQFAHRLKLQSFVVLDIGANVGLWTQELLRQHPESEVYCFEPARLTFDRLLENPTFVGRNVQCVNMALGREEGQFPLHYDKEGSGLASLTKRQLDHFGISFDKNEVVQVGTLDNWCMRTNTVPTVLKMDVEGHELDVLKGGLQTLESVRIVQFEFGGCNIDTRTYFQDFWYFFNLNGFKVFRISPLGPVAVDHYKEADEYFRTTNFVAVRYRIPMSPHN